MNKFKRQPKVIVKDIHGNSFGIKNVTSLCWNSEGNMDSIYCEFGTDSGKIIMFDSDGTNVFRNHTGNLMAEFFEEN